MLPKKLPKTQTFGNFFGNQDFGNFFGKIFGNFFRKLEFWQFFWQDFSQLFWQDFFRKFRKQGQLKLTLGNGLEQEKPWPYITNPGAGKTWAIHFISYISLYNQIMILTREILTKHIYKLHFKLFTIL